MAKEKAMKPCKNIDVKCDNMLSARSKHDFCPRCRSYDKRVGAQSPLWVLNLLSAYTRRSHLLAPYIPKKERDNVHFVEFRSHTTPQARKRA